MRIALVGPMPPLRGGIAHHTAQLQSSLLRHADVLTVAFERLYPSTLFPGRSPYEPAGSSVLPQEDAGNTVRLDALKPSSWRAAVRAITAFGPCRVLVPWWTVALTPCLYVVVSACRKAGVSTTFLCHNIVDHEGAWWKRYASARVLRLGQDHVVASEAEADRLRSLVPGTRPLVHPHPIRVDLPPPQVRLARRANREFLFHGFIRHYKGLDVLIEALPLIGDSDWMLTVAGEPWEDLAPLKKRAADLGVTGQIEWIEEYLPAEQVTALFQRADVVVLPYRSATGSAVLAQALGQHKPVVASDIPGLREQVVAGETGWLVRPEHPCDLAAALAEARHGRTEAMGPAIRSLHARWTWDSLAQAVLSQAVDDLA